jgi:hypothetical protein
MPGRSTFSSARTSATKFFDARATRAALRERQSSVSSRPASPPPVAGEVGLRAYSNGRPVAELRPHRPPRAKSLIGLHKGQTKILGDIVSPIGAGLWKALK